jgi:hypothetical protein
MRRILQFLTLSLAAITALAAAQSASAQTVGTAQSEDTPRVELFGGYSYLRANIIVSDQPFNLNGGSASLAYNFNDWLGVVGDVGVYSQGSVRGNGLSLTLWSYQMGPRLSLRKNKHVVPFGQVLLGAGHAGGTLYTTSLGPGLAPLGTNNAFLLTAGVGIDWKLNHTVGIRLVQAEYLYSQFLSGSGNGNQQSNIRLSAGITLRFGKH